MIVTSYTPGPVHTGSETVTAVGSTVVTLMATSWRAAGTTPVYADTPTPYPRKERNT